jgi:hypothetical protein
MTIQIPNLKHQWPIKFQISNSNAQKKEFFNFGHWKLEFGH